MNTYNINGFELGVDCGHGTIEPIMVETTISVVASDWDDAIKKLETEHPNFLFNRHKPLVP